MHLREPRFTYSACRLFTKTKEPMQKANKIKFAFNMAWPMEILKI